MDCRKLIKCHRSLAATCWFFISNLGFSREQEDRAAPQKGAAARYSTSLYRSFYLFYSSIWTGAKLIFTSRKYIWLIPGYSFALYGHRYLENGIAPVIARRYLGRSEWSQVCVIQDR